MTKIVTHDVCKDARRTTRYPAILALLLLPAWSLQAAPDESPKIAASSASKKISAPQKVAHSAVPYEPIKHQDDTNEAIDIEMYVGESKVFPTPGVARIAVGNRQVMTAEVLDEKDTIIFANAAGSTSLYIWNTDGHFQRIKVHIAAVDIGRTAREVAAFLANIEHAKTSVIGDKVIVEGDDLSDADRDKIAELAKRYPQIVNFTSPIGWEQMVMMDVKVVEFPKTALRDLGLKWGTAGGAAIGGIWSPVRRNDQGTSQINITPGPGGGLPITAPGGGIAQAPSGLTVLSALNLGLNAQLNALEQQGTATVLAEPQLSTRSGFKASFLAGGEFPYSAANVNGVTIAFKPYGIRLDIEPRVGSNGVVRAVIESEVSSIDASVNSTAGPALLTRRTKTEFNVREGETIVLAGLIQRGTSSDVDKVPLLGDIPILGALFKSRRFQNKETELVIFVTPTIVDSRTPALLDRIERTRNRLEQEFGKPPHLTAPLQPGLDPAAAGAHKHSAGPEILIK